MSQFEIEALLEQAALDPGIRMRLARYGQLVLEAGRRFNLTGAKSDAQIADHLLDSLTVVPYVGEPYVDIGSGAGFPALPVAIATGSEVTLIEATAKKARFLEFALEALQIPGRVVIERAEEAGHRSELRERFAAGTARGVGSAPTVAELLLPFIAVEGAAVLQRGQITTLEQRALEDAALMLGAVVEGETGLEGARRLVILRKRHATPERFSRRAGVPSKRPLCVAPEKRSP